MIIKGFSKSVGEFKLVPLKKTQEDFEICKEVFTDESIMKHSTIFNQKIGNTEQIQKIFDIYTNSWITDNIGEYKILNKNDEVLGIAGFIISDRNSKGQANVLNLGCYLMKEKSIQFTSNILYLLTKSTFDNYKNIEEIIAYSLTRNYLSCLSLCKIHYNIIGKLNYNNMMINYFSFKKIDYNSDKYKIQNIKSIKQIMKKIKNTDFINNMRYINYLNL